MAGPRPMAGRRPKLADPARVARLLEALRVGNYRNVACRVAGVCDATFYRYMEKGEADLEHDVVSPESEFLKAVKAAEAEAEDVAVAAVRRAFPDDWKAAMTYLERRNPTGWARTQKVEHVGEPRYLGKDRVEVDLAALSPEDLALVAEVLSRAQHTNGASRTHA